MKFSNVFFSSLLLQGGAIILFKKSGIHTSKALGATVQVSDLLDHNFERLDGSCRWIDVKSYRFIYDMFQCHYKTSLS